MTAKIKLNAASGGGSFSLQAPSSSSNNRVIALPDIADGTLVTSQSTLDATKLSGNLPAISGASLTGIPTDIDFASWRVTSNWSGITDPIQNFTQKNHNITMGYSSGIFSFPTTGFWHIMMQTYLYYNADQDNIELHLMTTTNNSSYSTTAQAYSHMNNDDGGNLFTFIQVNHIFDVTDVSTHKVKFKTAGTSANFHTNSSSDESYAIFKRLGDT